MAEPVFLVFGKTGWIGGLLGDVLREQGAKFEYATARCVGLFAHVNQKEM